MVNEILTGEFLNTLVMNLVSFPIYVNLTHFCVSFFSCFSVCLFLLLFRMQGSYLLLSRSVLWCCILVLCWTSLTGNFSFC